MHDCLSPTTLRNCPVHNLPYHPASINMKVLMGARHTHEALIPLVTLTCIGHDFFSLSVSV